MGLFLTLTNNRISSCSRAVANLVTQLERIPALEYCELTSVDDLAYLSVTRQPRNITINACCQCSHGEHGSHLEAPLGSLTDIIQLILGGTALEPAKLDLSRLPGLSMLEINSDFYPLEKVVLEAKNLLHLSLINLNDICFSLCPPFLLNKLSFRKLEILTVKDCSIRTIGDIGLEFGGLHTIEISNVKNADLLFSQSFPAIANVLFSSTRKGEINKFLINFVERHSPHLDKLLLQRRIGTKYLLDGSRPCLTTRRFEVLTKAAAQALLRCQLQVFSLEGRVYLEPDDLESFWKSSRDLKQVYIAPPNALVGGEILFQVC